MEGQNIIFIVQMIAETLLRAFISLQLLYAGKKSELNLNPAATGINRQVEIFGGWN